jgi:hypothetical protein
MSETIHYGGPHEWSPASHEVKVIFRKWPDGEITALFPELPYDYQGWSCMSYERVGQHAGANCHLVIRATRAATREEYKALLSELGWIGYKRLNIVQRMTPGMLETRRRNARRPL